MVERRACLRLLVFGGLASGLSLAPGRSSAADAPAGWQVERSEFGETWRCAGDGERIRTAMEALAGVAEAPLRMGNNNTGTTRVAGRKIAVELRYVP